MDIVFNCDKCGQQIAIDEAGARLQLHCPKCGASVEIPATQFDTATLIRQNVVQAKQRNEDALQHLHDAIDQAETVVATLEQTNGRGIRSELPQTIPTIYWTVEAMFYSSLVSSFAATLESGLAQFTPDDPRLAELQSLLDKWNNPNHSRPFTQADYFDFVADVQAIGKGRPNYLKPEVDNCHTPMEALIVVEEVFDKRVVECRLAKLRSKIFAVQEQANSVPSLGTNEGSTPNQISSRGDGIPSLTDFVGQDKLKERLQLAIAAARLRREALEHMLLLGPDGVGKATLAALIARAMGTNCIAVRAEVIAKPGDLAGLLTKLDTGDVLFVDQIHRVRANVLEYLVQALCEFRLDIVLDQETNARSVTLNLPRFTLIATANKLQQVSPSLLPYFSIREELLPYPPSAMTTILARAAASLGIEIEPSAIELIAADGNGIPRDGLNLLKRVRDYAHVKMGSNQITKDIANDALTLLIDRAQQRVTTDAGRIPVPREIRIDVWRRDGGRCVKCGSREKLEFDHIVPVSKGGSNTARNVELLCETCNGSKGDRLL